MEGQKEMCDIKTNWLTNPGQNITDVVLYRSDDQDDSNSEGNQPRPGGVTLTVTGEEEPSGDKTSSQPTSPCEITIVTKESPGDQSLVTAVDILCNARKSEVFADDVGYIATEEGICLDKELDISEKLHLIQHSFEPGIKKCSFKLLQTVEVNKIWIQSIHISVEPTKKSILPLGLTGASIDLDKVKDIMSDMGSEVPPGAKSLLENLERLQKNKAASLETMVQNALPSGGGMEQMGMLMSMVTSMSAVKSTVSGSGISDKTIKDSLPSPSGSGGSEEKNSSTNDTRSRETSESDKTPSPSLDTHTGPDVKPESSQNSTAVVAIQDLMSSFEKRLHKQIAEAEDRIMKRTLERLSAIEYRLQDKLDKMIERLPVNSSTMPPGGNSSTTPPGGISRQKSGQRQSLGTKSQGVTPRMKHSDQLEESKENQSGKPRHGRRGGRNPRSTMKEGLGDTLGQRNKDNQALTPAHISMSSPGGAPEVRSVLSEDTSKSRSARRRGRQRKRLQEKKKNEDLGGPDDVGSPEDAENLKNHWIPEDTDDLKHSGSQGSSIPVEV